MQSGLERTRHPSRVPPSCVGPTAAGGRRNGGADTLPSAQRGRRRSDTRGVGERGLALRAQIRWSRACSSGTRRSRRQHRGPVPAPTGTPCASRPRVARRRVFDAGRSGVDSELIDGVLDAGFAEGRIVCDRQARDPAHSKPSRPPQNRIRLTMDGRGSGRLRGASELIRTHQLRGMTSPSCYRSAPCAGR